LKIAILSDIHANIFALEAVVKEIKRQGVDSIICLGDLVMTGSRPAETFDLMEYLNPDIWIQGNTDGWLSEIDSSFHPTNKRENEIVDIYNWTERKLSVRQKKKLTDLPIFQEKEFDGIPLSFCHGSPSSNNQLILPDTPKDTLIDILEEYNSDILFCGHSHIRFVIPIERKSIVNFGSISIPGEDMVKQARYGIIHIINGVLSFQHKECAYVYEAFKKDLYDTEFPDRNNVIRRFEG
jgi:predicted phosphodiesterase